MYKTGLMNEPKLMDQMESHLIISPHITQHIQQFTCYFSADQLFIYYCYIMTISIFIYFHRVNK